MTQQTISGKVVVSLPGLAGIEKQQFDEYFKSSDYRKAITYRRYHLDDDNLTGDVDRDTYTDYSIYALVFPAEIENKLVRMGYLQVGDAEIWLKARIRTDINGDNITEFRPQIDDEVIFNNYTYRIKNILPQYSGEYEISFKCMCTRKGNDNPDVAWNSNYTEPQYNDDGSGWS